MKKAKLLRPTNQKFSVFFLTGLLFLVGSSVFAQPAINSGSPACAWPHNVAYAHGLLPNNVSFATMNQSVSQLYVNWYSAFVTSSGAGGHLRVQRPSNNNDTVSEGIGYGLLIAVMMADQTLFNGLYLYAKQYIPDANGHYLMNWQINSGGGVIGSNGATDADEDIAMALLMADKQWGSGGTINYKSEFTSMVTAIWNYEDGTGVINPGDAYSSPLFSSYMTPAWYRCWVSQDSGHAWANCTTWVYNNFFTNVLTQWPNGMAPNCINNSSPYNTAVAIPGGTEPALNMGYDASRFPMRVGLDYLWNGLNATQIQTFANTVINGVSANGFQNYIQEYWTVSTGVPSGSPCSHLQIGPALVAAMTTTNQSFINNAYTELWNRVNGSACPGLSYFQDTLALMCALIATGNFPNIVCGGSTPCVATTPVPTATPRPCLMLSDFEDGTTRDATNGYWFTFCYVSVANTPQPTAVPPRAAVSSAAYISDSSGGANGTNYAGRVTGFWDDNGQSTPATYGGFALAAELNLGYRNLTSPSCGPMTEMTFYAKSTAPCTIRVNFYNPAIDVSGGGNGNQYGYTTPLTTSWALYTVDLVSIACQNWGTGTCPPVSGGTTYTQALALNNVTSIQFQTAGGPTTANTTPVTVGFWVDQVCLTFQNCKPSTATPLPTWTPVPGSPTWTSTPTYSFTPTPASNTNTFTPTLTRTNTFTNTFTLTPTFTFTPTPTRTFTPTFTNTPTFTTAFTNTFTNTNTSTNTPTFTNTAANTNTFTNTATRTFTSTFTNTSTNTSTATATYTNTSANTNTFTNTPTNTLSATPTSTATRTFTPSFTNTLTFTNTPVNTSTFTNTFTNSFTNTPVNTNTFTPTFTNTPTRTFTPTFTNTSTNTSTFTNSFTNTPTKTFTPTFTNSFTNTATITFTPTNTYTPTNSPTGTLSPSNTPTNTLTFTNSFTSTNTPTFTNTFTRTFTPTNTPTFTSTFTNTPVNTNTPTFTNTSTNSFTFTFTNSPTITSTFTNSFTPTNTNTGTNPPTNTFTSTSTPTNTSTPTRTFTNTSTSTPTFTKTNSFTPTNTPVFTSTSTPTPVSVTVAAGPSAPPDSTQLPGVANTPVAQIVVSNPSSSTVTVTSLTITSNGSGNASTGITGITLFNNSTFVQTQTFSGTTATFTGLSITIPASGSVTLQTNATFSNTAAAGTYPFMVSALTGTNGQPTSPITPYNAATITIAIATSTPTDTLTATSTITPTFTPTAVTVMVSTGPSAPSSSTQLPGASNLPVVQVLVNNPSGSSVTVTSLTFTDSGTGSPSGISGINLLNNGSSAGNMGFIGSAANFGGLNIVIPASGSVTLQGNVSFTNSAPGGTYQINLTGAAGANGQTVSFNGVPYTSPAVVTIASATATPTPTEKPEDKPVVYPNPSNGSPVNVLPATYSGSNPIKVEIFTVAFRKVAGIDYPAQTWGPVQVNLVDSWGSPLASGLYYVVVTVQDQKQVTKLLLLR